MKLNLENIVKIHDSKQFEIKLGYFLKENMPTTDYKINLYFFIPDNLGTTPLSYNKNHFYEDLLSYVRIMPLTLGLDSLKNEFENLISNKSNWLIDSKLNKKLIKYEVKILCNIYRIEIKKFYNDIIERKLNYDDIILNVEKIRQFRHLLKKFKNEVIKYDIEEDCLLLNYADEYTSFIMEGYFIRIADKIKDSFGKEIFELLKNYALEENIYRKNNFGSTISEDPKHNASVIYRYNVLKKYFHKVLSIATDKKEDATGMKHIMYALAAGIAMVFATTVTFITQRKYGNFTMSFFVALVISYMFKDRIKDFTKYYFSSIFKNKMFDYKMTLKDMESGKNFGILKERVKYISAEEVPNDVVELRLMNTDKKLTNWNSGERIIKYEKKIKLLNKVIDKHFKDKISAVKDVMIFNVGKILSKSEDPKTKVYYIDENGEILQKYVDKFYHLNMIIEFETPKETIKRKIRLILTRNGIEKIELIA